MRPTVAAIALVLLSSACAGSLEQLAVGDCFDDWDGLELDAVQEVESVPIVDCSEPHDNELYLVERLPDGPFPGDTAMEEMAVGTCFDAFAEFVGTPYEDSRLDFGFLISTDEMWDSGVRTISCFVWDVEFLKLTGSMRNAGI